MKDRIISLHSEGLSYTQIQNVLGCSKGTIAYHLGVGQKDKQNQRRRNKRSMMSRFVQEFKTGKVCADCKEPYPYWILEFDHLSDKKGNVSQYRHWAKSVEDLQNEIAKCDIVCSNCHKNRTFHRLLKHGENCNLQP